MNHLDLWHKIITEKMEAMFGPVPGAPPEMNDQPDANRVLRRCQVNDASGCWEWQGATSAKGYGRVKIDGKILLPHRVIAHAHFVIARHH